MMHKILVTCPPMIGMIDEFKPDFEAHNFTVTVPEFTQEMSEEALCSLIGDFDGWIIGDDPATRRVVEAGVAGRLKACMRWGVGVNNVDFEAFKEHGIPVENTPGVFGREVADLAMHYVGALARNTFQIHEKVKAGIWHKPVGTSLWSTSALIIGFGDIGRNLARRLHAHDVNVHYYDPYVYQDQVDKNFKKVEYPSSLANMDFLILTAPLTDETRHIFNTDVLECIESGLKLINVGRGPLLDEQALVQGLENGKVSAAALDVLENEPFSLEKHQHLTPYLDRIILGSHSGSNTREAVSHVSQFCIKRLHEFLQD